MASAFLASIIPPDIYDKHTANDRVVGWYSEVEEGKRTYQPVAWVSIYQIADKSNIRRVARDFRFGFWLHSTIYALFIKRDR